MCPQVRAEVSYLGISASTATGVNSTGNLSLARCAKACPLLSNRLSTRRGYRPLDAVVRRSWRMLLLTGRSSAPLYMSRQMMVKGFAVLYQARLRRRRPLALAGDRRAPGRLQ